MSRPAARHLGSERGVALVAALLLLILMSAMLVGFMTVVVSDSRLRVVDRSRTQAFYAAHAGLEKLTADLGNLFVTDFSPEAADLIDLQNEPPAIANTEFVAPDGLGYTVGFTPAADGNPLILPPRHIESGPYQGLMGLITPYTLTVTAHFSDNSEARLQRTVNTVSIPVFQFGIFSETDLSFFPGPSFNFGGRVHSNRHLFLASGNTLTLSDRVTVVGEVVREELSNSWDTDNGYNGNVRAITAPGLFRNLAKTEGSVQVSLGSAPNEPTWTTVSIGTYNGNIRNGRTGAKRLDLPLITMGANPIDLIRRPLPGEDALVTDQRFFSQASVRILLSDTPAAITALPGVSGTVADLSTLASAQAAGYAGVVPLALSAGLSAQGYRSPADTPLIGGFLKVEYRNAGDVWVDVTTEILNLGFTKRNIDSNPAVCAADLSPNAVIRFQRVREAPATGAPCGVAGGVPSSNPYDYWPLVLYDTREGVFRDNNPAANPVMMLGGIMHYVELDVNNLRRWLAGEIGASGANAVNEDGYLVYFSDRRTNMDAGGNETGEYGFEDVVNRNNGNGNPNNTLEEGEDVNSDLALQAYGGVPIVPAGGTGPLNAAARPDSPINGVPSVARVNRPVFFRRALKVVNGALGNLPPDGLSIAAENPVYVEGHYNASPAGFGEPNAPAAIMADAVTLLSARWGQSVQVPQPGPDPWWHGDTRSMQFPNDPGQRAAQTTWYRVAVIAGKGQSFPHLNNTPQDFGTDGGVHNFLRYLESWGGQTLNYRGSMASFYFNRQAVGTYKCCTNVYSPPTRAYSFDVEFLDPSLLPPKTPMFRDINTTGFIQITK